MTLRDNLRTVAEHVRSISGPAKLDQRASRLTIRSRVWSGGLKGSGTATDTDLAINQYYPIRQITTREIASSGGKFEEGDLIIRHITPYNGTVGYTESQLKPVVTSMGTEIIYVITGQHSGNYAEIELQSVRNYSYNLVL